MPDPNDPKANPPAEEKPTEAPAPEGAEKPETPPQEGDKA